VSCNRRDRWKGELLISVPEQDLSSGLRPTWWWQYSSSAWSLPRLKFRIKN
jgi:hypothetical protein